MKNGSTLNNHDRLPDNETELFSTHNNGQTLGPSDRVIQNILSYSRSLVVIKTKMSGNFSLILN